MYRRLFFLIPLALLLAGCAGPNLDDSLNVYQDEARPLQERLDALQDIIATADARAVDVLLEALDSPEERIRATAAGGLGYFMDEKALAPLIKTLGDESPQVREAVVRSLVLFGDVSIDQLIATFHQTDEEKDSEEEAAIAEHRREAAAKVLVSIGESTVQPMLDELAALERDSFLSALVILSNPALRLRLDAEFAAYVDAEKVDPEEDYANNPTDSAARFIRRLTYKHSVPRRYLTICLNALDIDPPHYLETLRSDQQSRGALELTNRAFAVLGMRAINPLIQYRETDSRAAQLMCTHYMGHVGGRDATRLLIGILDERSDYAGQEVKEVALEALATIATPEAISELFNTIRRPELQDKAAEQIERVGLTAVRYVNRYLTDPDPAERAVAIWYFERTKNPEFQEVGLNGLLENLVVPVKVLRENAAVALSNMPALALEKVAELAGHDDADIREAVAISLGNMDDSRARPYLEELKSDQSSRVRAAAEEGLLILDSKGL